MYLISNWIVDGINNKIYKFTNDIIESEYKINIKNPIGDAGVVVSTDERTIGVTCPTAGMVVWLDTGVGEIMKYTNVGGTPIGICEGIPYGTYNTFPHGKDNRIPYFITNYSTNSVTIIKERSVVQTIQVGKGPKSIACDSYGRIYVANFNSNTISVLTLTDNNERYTLFNTINVGKFPNCLAINIKDDLFVVCQTSVYKIRKDNIEVILSISSNPVNITGDKFGNMWITNLTDNSISRITLEEKIFSYISGGIGPVYISSDKNGNIICLNTGDNTISRINEFGDVTNVINLDFVPMANGDFIGYMNRINVHDGFQKDDKISYYDLDDDLKLKIDSGGIDPETLIVKSDNVSYDNPEFTNITEAVNSLIYEKSGLLSEYIENFSISPSIVEIGSTVTSITFNYHINNNEYSNLTKAEINNGIGEVPINGNTYIATGLSINQDTEYKFTLTNNTMNIGEKITDIKFDKKIYYGINNNIISLPTDILSFDSVFVEDNEDNIYKKKLILNNGNGFLYIAIPSTLGISIDDISINDFKDSNWETSELNFTNASGHSEMYTLFRSGYTHNVSNYNIFININHTK